MYRWRENDKSNANGTIKHSCNIMETQNTFVSTEKQRETETRPEMETESQNYNCEMVDTIAAIAFTRSTLRDSTRRIQKATHSQ